MPTLSRKSLDAPDERVEVPGVRADVVEIADTTISRSVFEPGAHCPQIGVEGKPLCSAHHAGFVLSGTMHVEMSDGSTLDVAPNDVFDIPPGHDGWATGAEPLVLVTWAGFRSWVPSRTGERILVTLLVTDIVGSTARAVEVGDATWRQQLGEHYRGVRAILDRHRGREITTTGDGLLAAFDGAARAIDAAVAIRERAAREGLTVRAGVHSGEVEIVGDDLRGVTVHEAARIAAAADGDEILVSEATRILATGSSHAFESRGAHELKGLPGPRMLYAVASPAAGTRPA
jgi:class 3 adenylate cyclase